MGADDVVGHRSGSAPRGAVGTRQHVALDIRRDRGMLDRVMRTVILATLVLSAACKDKNPAPATAPTTKPSSSARATSPKPSLPSETPAAPTIAGTGSGAAPAKPSKPITIAEATAALPALTGKTVIGLKQTSDQQQVHGTWCMDGTSADDVAKQVGHDLAQAKYAGLSIRGDARKAAVSGDRDAIRFSMVVSASSAAVCQAPAHYFASATIFKL